MPLSLKLIDGAQLDGALGSTADAIRAKTGSEASISWNMSTGFAGAIENIVTLEEGTADANATSGDILYGKTAYVDGTLVTGTIPTKTGSDLSANGKTVSVPAGYFASATSADIDTGTIQSGTATIDSLSYSYDSTNDEFDVSGSGNVSAPSVTSAGYVSSSEGTLNGKSNGATVDATVAKIVGLTAITGTKEAKPVIAKQPINVSGVADAASGSATTTAPISGVYVAVSSPRSVNQITATPSVTTAGYGTADNHGIAAQSENVGAAASDTTYVPITTTSATVNGDTVSYGPGWIAEGSSTVQAGSVTQNAPTVNSSTGLVTATSTVVEGYVTAGTESNTLQLTALDTNTYNTSSTDQTISAGQYIIGTQTIKAVATNNIEAGNIKDGTTITVGDANNAGRIKNVTGTFTDASTVSNGQTAAAAAQIRSGYSAWVDGAEVLGSMNIVTIDQSETSVSGTTVTPGSASWNTGYIISGSIGAATFGNAAASGKTADDYTDVSNTTYAPVLVSGSHLFINKGIITDDIKISTAKLSPDGASVDLSSDVILSGYSAYNNDNVLVAGNIPTKTNSDLSASGKTVTVPAGYYASQYTKDVAEGEFTADTSASSNSTVTPAVNLDATATTTYGFTTTAPASGTTGTNYLTIDPDASATAWSVTPRANITTSGYITEGSDTGTAVTNTPSIGEGTNYYVPVVSVSFSGGGLTATNYSKNDLAVTLADGSDKNVTNYTVGNKDTTNYPYYVKVSGSTPAVSGTTTVDLAQLTYSNAAGVIAGHAGTEALAASSSSPTVNVNAAFGDTYVSLKGATASVTGTNIVTPSASMVGSNVTLSDTNNGIAIIATGGGSASVDAVATTSQTGYAPASTQLGAATLSASNTTTTATKYITGVTIPAPASGTTSFTVTVPNEDSTLTYTFNVASDGTVTGTPTWSGGNY